MDATFSFPAQSAPLARPRPRPAKPGATGPRESNALRASVLDVALELGIGNNSVVAEWMFSNTVQEEDEEPAQSPGLTHSYSTASTDEFSSSPRIPPTPPNASTPQSTFGALPKPGSGKPIAGWNTGKFPTDSEPPFITQNTFSPSSNPVAFPSYSDIPIPPRPATPESSGRFKKKGGDADESDGGYLSEIGRKRQVTGDLSKKEEKARLKEEKREQKKEAKELEKEERKRKKSLGALAKAAVSRKPSQDTEAVGYDTDGTGVSSSKSPFKSKTKKSKVKGPSTDAAGYETDGYQSAGSGLKKNKPRFFGLGSKSSKGDMRDSGASPTPEVPQLPMLPPIASKFATSLGALDPPPSSGLKFDPSEFGISSEDPPTTSSSATARPAIPAFVDDHTKPPLQSPSVSSSRHHEKDSFALSQTSPVKSVHDRSSLSSAETSTSSMSNNSRRRGLQFSPTSEPHASLGHGPAASVSTTNSSVLSSNYHSYGSAPLSRTQSPTSPPTRIGNLGPSGLKPPSISLPLTRSPSPMSPVHPVAPLQINKPSKPPQLEVNTRGVSPAPFSIPNSPYVMVTPSPAGSLHSPSISSVRGVSPIPPPTSRTTPVRPINPPTTGFGPQTAPPPRPAGLTSPASSNGRLSPNPMRGRRISPLHHPQDADYLNGDASDPNALPSPNVLAYYDIPPPSPPPMGPLPLPPSAPSTSNVPQGAASQLRNKVIERQKLVPELSSTIQRGKESPFPMRPVPQQMRSPMPPTLEVQDAYPSNGYTYRSRNGSPTKDDSALGADMNDTRSSLWDDGSSTTSSISGLAYDRPEENIQEVIDRFEDVASIRGSSEGHGDDGSAEALPRQRSFEALREKHESFPVSEYYGGTVRPRDTTYAWDDDDEERLKNRESRWSGSIYSRISIMDPDKSEEARDRFVARVEAMMAGRDQAEVPPVPKIPEGLANAGAWNRF